jgi:hypothetical protein
VLLLTVMGPDATIIEKQLEFFRRGGAGCVFSTVAGKNPQSHGWHHFCVDAQKDEVGRAIASAINDADTSTLSLIFPNVRSDQELVQMIKEFQLCRNVSLEQSILHQAYRCFGFRIQITKDIVSWVSGFGNYNFFPKTRQAPYTEIIFRTKPRPHYEEMLKSSLGGVVHLADMKMNIAMKNVFQKFWDQSFINTERILGRKPDLRSAAKTTFSLPERIFNQFQSA